MQWNLVRILVTRRKITDKRTKVFWFRDTRRTVKPSASIADIYIYENIYSSRLNRFTPARVGKSKK